MRIIAKAQDPWQILAKEDDHPLGFQCTAAGADHVPLPLSAFPLAVWPYPGTHIEPKAYPEPALSHC